MHTSFHVSLNTAFNANMLSGGNRRPVGFVVQILIQPLAQVAVHKFSLSWGPGPLAVQYRRPRGHVVQTLKQPLVQASVHEFSLRGSWSPVPSAVQSVLQLLIQKCFLDAIGGQWDL